MSADIKATAIPASGYMYQTMQGIDLLCDWLESPNRYVRVKFESDDEADAPTGLDDLVAQRPDGTVDLWQVKFTPSSDKYALDWDWFLAKPKPPSKARSNLKKWFDAFTSVDKNRLADVRLVTNRAPDLAMEACLKGGEFVDYTLAPKSTIAAIEAEVGGAEAAKAFFDRFRLVHSDKGFSSLTAHVTARLRKLGTPEGAEAVKNLAIRWAIEKDAPSQGGWITIEYLKQVLQMVPPEPLPENFEVPRGYRVPDQTFHIEFLKVVREATVPTLVLTGPPGRGKSTYLSRLCATLQKQSIPVIRHHYFLSTNDRTFDRHSSYIVQESLLSQIRDFHLDAGYHGDFRAAIEACSSKYKEQGVPFVVVLDGLDHVWRNQAADKRALDELFGLLLPTPENLILVVGTQPVDDAQLPAKLLAAVPRSTWKELPAMSADAVRSYLQRQLTQGRLQVQSSGNEAKRDLASAASSLRDKTRGHPLHVIYATEELIQSKAPLSTWEIDRLPGDMTQDAKQYYASLWTLLPASQKDVLSLVAAFPFFWPKNAFSLIAVRAHGPSPSVEAVEHLLHSSAAGLKAFHESLLVFVRQTESFTTRIKELTPHVQHWLETDAPTTLRVNWLWWVKARQGQATDLINGVTRDWVLERLQEGYPHELFEDLLEQAEVHAIDDSLYASAYRLRHLKSRLTNSTEFHLSKSDSARLKSFTWALAPDDSVIDEAIASRHESSTLNIAALAVALSRRGNKHNARRCIEDARRRYLGESRYARTDIGSDALQSVLYLGDAFWRIAVSATTVETTRRLVEEAAPPIVRKLLRAKVDDGAIHNLVQCAMQMPRSADKQAVCEAAVRVAALQEVDLTEWSNFAQLDCGPLIGCAALLRRDKERLWSRPLGIAWSSFDFHDREEVLIELAHDWFFSTLQVALLPEADNFCLLPAPEFKDYENVTRYLDALRDIAIEVASSWRANAPVSFSHLYTAFERQGFPQFNKNHHYRQADGYFRSALHRLAVDLHLINSIVAGAPLISDMELKKAMECSWFGVNQFREFYVGDCVKVLTDDAAKHFIEGERRRLELSVNEETGTRSAIYIDLAEIALQHDLDSLAKEICRTSWDLALGYGQRKDPGLAEMVEALRYLAPLSPADSHRLLMLVAPQIHNVLDYTDGKGTRHVIGEANELLAQLNRNALAVKHREHTEAGQWSSSESSLATFLNTADIGSPYVAALARTGLHGETLTEIRDAAATGSTNAAHLLELANDHTGSDAGEISRKHSQSSSEDSPSSAAYDVANYPVTDFERLRADLKANFGRGRRESWQQWYSHWEGAGQGSDLIAVLEERLLGEDCRDEDLNYLLDMAFATKLRLEGPAKAFPYIVQAQLFNGGWFGRYHMEDTSTTEQRLKLVQKKYPKRCDEFFRKSAWTWFANPRRGRIITGELLVYFLGIQGRTPEAIQVAETMAQCIREDTRTLNLPCPDWAKSSDISVESAG